MDDRLKRLEEEVTSGEGYWKSSTSDIIKQNVERLLSLDISLEDAVEVIEDLFYAIKEEYGD